MPRPVMICGSGWFMTFAIVTVRERGQGAPPGCVAQLFPPPLKPV